MWVRGNFSNQAGDGATFNTKVETARLSMSTLRWHDLPDKGGDGGTKNQLFVSFLTELSGAAFGSKPKGHSQTKLLSLENPDIKSRRGSNRIRI